MPNIIFCKDEEENIKVQKALFSVGIGWEYSGTILVNTDANFIVTTKLGFLGFINQFTYVVECLINKRYTALNAQSVINNPMIVDEAKLPEQIIITLSDGREFSESTIKAALKQYINEK